MTSNLSPTILGIDNKYVVQQNLSGKKGIIIFIFVPFGHEFGGHLFYHNQSEEVDSKYQLSYIIDAAGVLDGSVFEQNTSKARFAVKLQKSRKFPGKYC